MENLYNIASILNIIFIVAAMIGGYIALKSGKHQQTGTIQGQAIDALQAEIDVMKSRIGALEKENTRLTQIMGLIKQALRKRGLAISIDGDLVTISDNGTSQSARIQEHG